MKKLISKTPKTLTEQTSAMHQCGQTSQKKALCVKVYYNRQSGNISCSIFEKFQFLDFNLIVKRSDRDSSFLHSKNGGLTSHKIVVLREMENFCFTWGIEGMKGFRFK